MSSAVLMLSSETATMPHPKTPGYCLGRSPFETDSSSSKQDESFSVNHVTVTVLDARLWSCLQNHPENIRARIRNLKDRKVSDEASDIVCRRDT
uniref:S-locus receptor kinase C-terminal domain-containing protein n=1 Tax=Salix viminalis TaxID=40686 RepID=A0A6N2LNG0_SALVM